MLCPSCHHDNRPDRRFCVECGAALALKCSACTSPYAPGEKFCGECGAALEPVASRESRVEGQESRQSALAQVDASLSSGERRQLTVLFCDLMGSTDLSARLDPEEMREVMRVYYEGVSQAVTRFDGHVAKYLGDGVLAYFGYPRAHEDDPVRAISAGLAIAADLGVLNARALERVPKLRDAPIAVRIGAHTGLAVVGDIDAGGSREERAIIGDTPNIAARLQSEAAPNTVVISDATRRLVTGVFVLEDLGRRALKGIAEPMPLFRAVRSSGMRSRFDSESGAVLTPLVGRQQQLGLLLELWEQVQDGTGQVVLISGEPGIGKSRLIHAWRERLADEPHSWLECRCSPYHEHSALYPIVELIEQGLLFRPQDPLHDKLARVEGGIRYGGLSVPETLPLFATLLSLPLPESYQPPALSPEAQRRKTMEALVTWFFTLAQAQPMVLVVEDLHWVDPSTVELLTMLVDQVPTVPAMLIFTFRSTFQGPWTLRSHLSQLTVPRLIRKQVVSMARNIAGKALAPAVEEQLIAKTDGVPLFVEELTKMVLESDLLDDRGDRFELRRPLPALAIPSTLQDSLMARLDRLGPVKEVAQVAATLGREFSHRLIAALSPLTADALTAALAELVKAELLYRRGTPPEATYAFKNSLIQDAAYSSLLKSTRQQYHRRVAAALEERFPDLVAAQPEVLAHHYRQAGAVERAIEYGQRAGERANERAAHFEALHHFEQALQLVAQLPDGAARAQHELGLRIGLGVQQQLVKGFSSPEVLTTYTRARELCEQLGETPQIFPVLHGLWRFSLVRGDLRTADHMARSLMQMAEAVQDRDLLLQALWADAGTAFWMGDLERARARGEAALPLYDPDRHASSARTYGSDPGATALCYLAFVLWFLGCPDRAVTTIEQAVAAARRSAHPFSLAWATVFAAGIRQFRRDREPAEALAAAGCNISTEQGFPVWLGVATVLRAWALGAVADRENALSELQNGMATLASAGQELAGTWVLAVAAEVQLGAGQSAAASSLLGAALGLCEKNGERFYEPEVARLQGEVVLADTERQRNDRESEAERCFLRAIELARSQAGKALELRAATSLAGLWCDQGKRAEALALLAPIYGWFTEGFDTRDLQDAKSLLTQPGE